MSDATPVITHHHYHSHCVPTDGCFVCLGRLLKRLIDFADTSQALSPLSLLSLLSYIGSILTTVQGSSTFLCHILVGLTLHLKRQLSKFVTDTESMLYSIKPDTRQIGVLPSLSTLLVNAHRHLVINF